MSHTKGHLSLVPPPVEDGDPGPQEEYGGGWNEDPFAKPTDRLEVGREMMRLAAVALGAAQTTPVERATVAATLVADIPALAEMARREPPAWEGWCASVGIIYGFGGYLDRIRRAVDAEVVAAKARDRAVAQKQAGCGFRDRLRRSESGEVKPTYGNIVTILKGDPKFASLRMSTLGNVIELDGAEIKEDTATADLCEWLRDAYGMDAAEQPAKSALCAVAQGRPYSPVVDYLESVRGRGSDGVIGRLLTDGLGIVPPNDGPDSPRAVRHRMYATMLGQFMISAVARAMKPGSKVDVALILVGEQGAKKSSFLATLFGHGSNGSAFFADSPIKIDSKDGAMQLARVWGYEAAELDSFTTRSAEAVKQFLSSSVDCYRPPYGRLVATFPRHTVLCGSVNPSGGKGGTATFLTDSSGSRRFWILTVPENWVCPIAKVTALRDEAWAWALAEYEAGTRWWLEREEDIAREKDAAQYQVDDPWQEPVAEWLFRTGSANFTTRDVLVSAIKAEEKDHTARHSARVRSILVRLGWAEKASPTGYRGKRVWQLVEPVTP